MPQETRIVQVVGAAILRRGRCLVTQRGPGGANAFEWELPGGKIETGESPRRALEREIAEELGLVIEVGEFLGRGVATAGGHRIVLDIYLASILSGTLQMREHLRAEWLGPDEILTLEWSPADRPVLPELVRRLRALHAPRVSD